MKRYALIFCLLIVLLVTSCSGGGGTDSLATPEKSVATKISTLTNETGKLTESVNLATPDQLFSVELPSGVAATSASGDPVKEISLEPVKKVPEAPEGTTNIAAVDLGPDDTEFSQPVEVTLSYDPGSLPSGVSPNDLVIAYYDTETETWVELESITVDPVNHTVTGLVKHFTIFAVQVRGGAKPTTGSTQVTEVELTPLYDLPGLNRRLESLIGSDVWVIGYFGDSRYGHSGAAFLTEEPFMLMSDQLIPQESMARLDGELPGSDADNAAILIMGTVYDYATQFPDAFVPEPEPLVRVKEYRLLEFESPDDSLIDYLVQNPATLDTYLKGSSVKTVLDNGDEIAMFIPINDNGRTVAESFTKASDCDRVLIISGGVRDSANYPRYAHNVKKIYEKCTELGFNDGQIDVVYYNGKPSGIDVGGNDIVDQKATKENIQAIIDRYMKEMNPSCTLALFVTDHGTGYEGGTWNGERPALGNTVENGGASITYLEKTSAVDGNDFLWDSIIFVDGTGKKWRYTKHRFNGTAKFYRRVGENWVETGGDTNGDGWIKENELGVDLNGDGDDTDADYGFNIAGHAAAMTHSKGEWDTDRDKAKATDVKFVWEGGKLVLQRLVDGTWKKIGEDTNGDGKIDSDDGGIDWNADGDKNDNAGFHEGINLLGADVLWDDELAEMLRPLAERGVHISALMSQCFSGGFLSNLQGLVEFIGAGCVEDVPHISYTYGGTSAAWEMIGFLQNWTGIEPEAWSKAWEEGKKVDLKAWEEDLAGETEAVKKELKNVHQTGGTKLIESETIFKRGTDGTYLISVVPPLDVADAMHDFEIIFGLQQPRWHISLENGVGFPDGLPEGLDSELIPGGIRVYGSSPFGAAPVLVKMKAPDGTEITRIEITDANHSKIGYTKTTAGVIPDRTSLQANLSAEVADSTDPETCICSGKVNLQASASNIPGSLPGYISMVEISIDGTVINRARFLGDSGADDAPPKQWQGTYSVGVEPGKHVARIKVVDTYGYVVTKEVEFSSCEDNLKLIPTNQVSVQLDAGVDVITKGTYEDCEAVMTVSWVARTPVPYVRLKAAWLRINGQFVASSVPPPDPDNQSIEEAVTRMNIMAFGGLSLITDPNAPPPDPGVGESNSSLGGLYTAEVNPGETITIEVIALGTDCKYYVAAWEKVIPNCPKPCQGRW